MYSDYLDHLPDSKHFGVLNAFPFDQDYLEDDYEIEEEAFRLANVYIETHFPQDVIKLHHGEWVNNKWVQKQNAAIAAIEVDTLYRFWNAAKKVVKLKTKKDDELALEKALKRMANCKYKVLVATTNHTSQHRAEAFLKKLGFRVKLKFTNPNHCREDTLNLWVKKL